MNFPIYRLCRDNTTVLKKNEEDKKYGFKRTINVTGLDYFSFLNKIIKECRDDHVLVCHEDVFLPLDIAKRVKSCVQRSNERFGADNWGVVGNAGVDYFSKKTIRYIKDPHSATISSGLAKPQPVVFVDGNLMLVNVRNFQENKISLPSEAEGFHLYDFLMIVESYINDLACAVDSELFVVHNSGGDGFGFRDSIKSDWFVNYWNKNFSNDFIYTINSNQCLDNNLEGINEEEGISRLDFYKKVDNVLLNIYKKNGKQKELNIIIRTQLNRINYLKRNLKSVVVATKKLTENKVKVVLSVNNATIGNYREVIDDLLQEFSELNIEVTYGDKKTTRFPRVDAIAQAVNFIDKEESSFVWIVDDDDFLMPNSIEKLINFLDEKYLLLGNSFVFKEQWDNSSEEIVPIKSKMIMERNCVDYELIMRGDNDIPICSVIYPLKILKEIVNKYKLSGDYYEDYTLLLMALKKINPVITEFDFAGISYHEANTVGESDRTHWDYSYATFMAEIVNSGYIQQANHDFIVSKVDNIKEKDALINSKDNELRQQEELILSLNKQVALAYSSKFWKLRELYEKTKFVVFHPVRCLKKYL